MSFLLAFIWIIGIFIALAFGEGYMEGRHGWAAKAHGWRLKIANRELTAYHFWVWLVMLPLVLTLPLALFGFNLRLFGFLIATYFIGAVVNDFAWYLVNPKVSLKDLNPSFAKWYNWWNIFGIKIPDFFIFYPIIAFVIYWFVFFF